MVGTDGHQELGCGAESERFGARAGQHQFSDLTRCRDGTKSHATSRKALWWGSAVRLYDCERPPGTRDDPHENFCINRVRSSGERC